LKLAPPLDTSSVPSIEIVWVARITSGLLPVARRLVAIETEVPCTTQYALDGAPVYGLHSGELCVSRVPLSATGMVGADVGQIESSPVP
jgi:hypothetical protein